MAVGGTDADAPAGVHMFTRVTLQNGGSSKKYIKVQKSYIFKAVILAYPI